MPGPDLSIVIVSWNSGEDLLECVASLAALARSVEPGESTVELIVVDNASGDFPAVALRELWPTAEVVVNRQNRGFGPAANQGSALAAGEILLFLNPDTRAVDDPVAPLLEAFASHPEAVAVAPRLVDPEADAHEGQARFQLRRLPGWRQALRELLLVDKLLPNGRGLRRDRYLDRDRNRPFAVEQPAAAALAVRREVFLALGGFDERFVPAWFEDVDLCARLLQRGTILYWPTSRFVHGGRVALTRLGYDRFLPVYYGNAIRYWRKHHGRLAALAFRVLVAKGMFLRLAVLPLIAPETAGRRSACRAYLRTVRCAALGSGR